MGNNYLVVLTDADHFPLDVEHKEALRRAGAEVIGVPHGATEQQLAEICKDADALLVFAAKITQRIIQSSHLKIIARCGIGYDNIDLQYAFEQGITVTYVPDFCLEEVSDHTIALMLDCWRKLSYSRDQARNGHWWDTMQKLSPLRRIKGQSIGLIGFGRIAQSVARKLSGFGVTLVAYDPFVPQSVMQDLGVQPVSLSELLRVSDVVSLHTPLTDQTRHMMNRQLFEQMKDGAIFINTSRGPLLKEEDLLWALNSGKLSAAGLDVLEVEPPVPNHPLTQMTQVIVTPHTAAYSDTALHEVKARAIEEVIRKFNGLPPHNPVPMKR